MYLIGGIDLSSQIRLNDMYKSSDGKEWAKITDNAPFSKRDRYSCVIFQDSIILTGGTIDGTNELNNNGLNDVWK